MKEKYPMQESRDKDNLNQANNYLGIDELKEDLRHYLMNTRSNSLDIISQNTQLIDSLYFMYSDRGANLSDLDMVKILDIDMGTWQAIKQNIGLTKDGDVASDITMKAMIEDEDKIQEYLLHAWESYDSYIEIYHKKNIISAVKSFFSNK